jgi:hypothetical protein
MAGCATVMPREIFHRIREIPLSLSCVDSAFESVCYLMQAHHENHASLSLCKNVAAAHRLITNPDRWHDRKRLKRLETS